MNFGLGLRQLGSTPSPVADGCVNTGKFLTLSLFLHL